MACNYQVANPSRRPSAVHQYYSISAELRKRNLCAHTHTHTSCNQNIRPPPLQVEALVLMKMTFVGTWKGGFCFSFCFVYGFGIITTRPINKSVRTGDWTYDYVLLQRRFGAYKQKWQRHQREEQTDDRSTLITPTTRSYKTQTPTQQQQHKNRHQQLCEW